MTILDWAFQFGSHPTYDVMYSSLSHQQETTPEGSMAQLSIAGASVHSAWASARLLVLPCAAFAAGAPELEVGSAFTRTMATSNKLARGVAVGGVL